VTELLDILGFVAKLHVIDRELHDVAPAILARACEMVAKEARRVIGVGYDDWPALQASTIAEKVRQGYYAPAPLLRTGQLRSSIEWSVDEKKLEAEVGTDDPVAAFQELGTLRIPPRSFLAGAAKHVEEKIHRMAAKAAVAVLEGQGLNSAAMGELIHLLKHTFHHVKEQVEDMFDEPDDEHGEGRKGRHP
jgi:hypothetical protein